MDDDNATLVVQKGKSEKVKDALEMLNSLNIPTAKSIALNIARGVRLRTT